MNTPEQNIVNSFKDKNLLFIENDNSFSSSVQEFHNIIKRAGIKHTVMFNLSEQPLEEIKKQIQKHDGIVFMTQWVYPISKTISEYMRSLKKKKIVVQCYLGDPTWYYQPDDVPHEIYIYKCMVQWGEPDKETESFYKLSNKPYWDYKNNFDQ
jgi:hypothetical protein